MGFGDFFRRVLIPVRQRPSSADHNTLQWRQEVQNLAMAGMAFGGSQMAPATASTGRYSSNGASGFYAGGFWCVLNLASPPFGVKLTAGLGFSYLGPTDATDIDSNQGANWEYQGQWGVPLALSQDQSFTVPPPPPVGSSRIDIIEVRADYLANDPQTVGIFNTGTEVFNPTVLNKSLTWDLYGRTGSVTAPNPSTACISYVTGQTVAGAITAATEPTTTAGYMKVARINLDASGGAIAALTDAMIADMRRPILAHNIVSVSGQATIPGRLAGVGTESLDSVQLQPGQVLKAVLATAAGAGGAGISYTMYFYLIGGDLRSSIAGNNGAVVATALATAARRTAEVTAVSVGRLIAADVAILNGTDANYTVVNGLETFAIGQPYAFFALRISDPAAAALTNSEILYFNYTLNLGANIA